VFAPKYPQYLHSIETYPPQRLAQIQQRRLRAVLAYASQSLPFYQERFRRAGITPQEIQTVDDLRRLPRITKSDLVAAFRARGYYQIGIEGLGGQQAANVVMTSGTLNFPTFASLAPYELDRGSVRCVMRELWMQGIRPGMKVLVLLPGWHYLSLLESRALTHLGAHCIIPFGTHLSSHADRFIMAAAAARPDYILAFAPMMHALIEGCYAIGRRPQEVFFSVRYVSVVGEPLTPGMRERLKAELELNDVFERGGSSDGLWGGGECEYHRGHHVYADYFLIEVVDPASGNPVPPGELGSIVVTTLSLGKSIYLRFDCEDWGMIVPGPCPCGRTHPVIELHDRLANTLTIAGRQITSQQVRCMLDEIPALVGRPFLIERLPTSSTQLYLHLARVPGQEESDLAIQIERKCRQQLGVSPVLTWHDRMPDGWKGRIVDTARVREGLWARR
jgi:phenylacetate-CoA ligase